MNDKAVKVAANAITSFVRNHETLILTTACIAGVVWTAKEAFNARIKAEEVLAELPHEATKTEKAKALLPVVAPTLIVGTLTCAGIGTLGYISNYRLRSLTELATMYNVSQNIHREYRHKVADALGPDRELDIRNRSVSEEFNSMPRNGVIVQDTGHGDQLFYEPDFGTFFYSSTSYVRNQIAKLQTRLIQDNYITMNDVYSALGLDERRKGDEFGWDITSGQKLLLPDKFESETFIIGDMEQSAMVLDLNSYSMWSRTY